MVVVIDLNNPIPSHVIEKELEETKLIVINPKPRKILVIDMTDMIVIAVTIATNQTLVVMIKNEKSENTKMMKGTKTIVIWTNHEAPIGQRHHRQPDQTVLVPITKQDRTGMNQIVLFKLQRKLSNLLQPNHHEQTSGRKG